MDRVELEALQLATVALVPNEPGHDRGGEAHTSGRLVQVEALELDKAVGVAAVLLPGAAGALGRAAVAVAQSERGRVTPHRSGLLVAIRPVERSSFSTARASWRVTSARSP